MVYQKIKHFSKRKSEKTEFIDIKNMIVDLKKLIRRTRSS